MNVILFDLDGTLLDSTEAILEGFSVAYESFGKKSPSQEKVLSLIGHPLDFMFAHLGIATHEVSAYVDAYKAHYRLISKPKTTFLPFAKEAIEKASTFATLGVVTTKTGLYSRELLEHMGVMHYFDVLIGRENVDCPKPHPEPVLKAMECLGATKENTWMIGDTSLDILAAHGAGISSVGVLCGYGKREELLQYSQSIVETPLDAVEFISKKVKK